MKTIFRAQIISNLLVILSFLLEATTVSSHESSTEQATTPEMGRSQLAKPIGHLESSGEQPATNNLSATTVRRAQSSALTGRTLIGSILTRAANLNSVHQHNPTTEQSSSSANDQDVDDDPSQEQSSLLAQFSVPTDSGEDPLESTTSGRTGRPTEESQTVGDSGQSPANTSGPTTPTGELVGDELALDSNNVSAIIMSPTDQPPATTGRLQPPPPITCEQAYTQCALRKACAPGLKAYNDHCHELISNQTDDCSPKCLDAMTALRSSEEGDDLARCDCQSNDYCLASKQRSQLCKPQVDRALDPKTVVSCSTASWICTADQSCAPALSFYYRNCRSLLSQRHCSARCNNSLNVLYHQPKALKLISCRCDGSEEFPCQRLKTYTEQLCLNGPISSLPPSGLDEEADGPTTEEDSSNLTNNPENFLSGVPIDIHLAAGDSDKDAANAAEESNYNGIQLVEDNYIPLISSRYFTNLHHQRQQLQSGQSKQRHKPKEHKQQQTRRIQRNMRQQRARSADSTNATLHEGKRSRLGRIFMFASSKSSASSVHIGRAHRRDHWMLSSLVWTLVVAIFAVMGCDRTSGPAVTVY